MRTIVYFDITNFYISRGMTGIQRALRSLLPRFIENQKNYEVRVLFFDASRGKFAVFDNNEVLDILQSLERKQLNPVQQMEISDINENDIFFDLDSVWNITCKRSWLYPELKSQGVSIYVYIYDLIPLKFPYYAHPDTLRNFTTFISAVYAHADLVFVDSRSTERDFIELKEDLSVDRFIPTVVTGLGNNIDIKTTGDKKPKILRKLLRKKYILFVGTLEPRKNQELLLDSFNKIAETDKKINLVFVGKEGWLNKRFTDKLLVSKYYGKRIYWLQDVDDFVLEKLYKKSFLNVYISNYEGYGLPIAEALKHGKPIITSKNSSMYEVGLDFADYIEYETENELVDSINL